MGDGLPHKMGVQTSAVEFPMVVAPPTAAQVAVVGVFPALAVVQQRWFCTEFTYFIWEAGETMMVSTMDGREKTEGPNSPPPDSKEQYQL